METAIYYKESCQEKEWKKAGCFHLYFRKRRMLVLVVYRLYKTKQGYNEMKDIIRFILR